MVVYFLTWMFYPRNFRGFHSVQVLRGRSQATTRQTSSTADIRCESLLLVSLKQRTVASASPKRDYQSRIQRRENSASFRRPDISDFSLFCCNWQISGFSSRAEMIWLEHEFSVYILVSVRTCIFARNKHRRCLQLLNWKEHQNRGHSSRKYNVSDFTIGKRVCLRWKWV